MAAVPPPLPVPPAAPPVPPPQYYSAFGPRAPSPAAPAPPAPAVPFPPYPNATALLPPVSYYPVTQPVVAGHPDHTRQLTVAKYDAACAAHAASFEAASERYAEIDASRRAQALHDTSRLADCAHVLHNAVRDSTAAFTAGNHLMNAATGVVDNFAYRTRYSPSSAHGPCGPYGPTADAPSPYVSGALHQR
eukprot:Hpha_TRINITY_DN35495_c0_g1::TRINITY_DN35495_c0_g1_i1::g.83375::m.83375